MKSILGSEYVTLAVIYSLGAFAITIALMGGMHLSAQGIASHNTRAPVTIDAGRIVAQDRQDRVIFTGNVVVTQAGLTVRSERMQLNYINDANLELQRITATGGVTVVRGNERATGSSAIYDFNRRVITMAGNVRLQRGDSTLSGGRLVIDLDSGLATVDGSAPAANGTQLNSEGRVRGTFAVPQE